MNITIKILDRYNNRWGTHVLNKIDGVYVWRWVTIGYSPIGELIIDDGRDVGAPMVTFRESDIEKIKWK